MMTMNKTGWHEKKVNNNNNFIDWYAETDE